MSAIQKNFEPSSALLKSGTTSLLILLPSLLVGLYLMDNRTPLHSAPYLLIWTVLILAGLDFVAVLFLEPYRRRLSALTLPSLISVMTVVLLFVVADALNILFQHLGYNFLSPLAAACVALIYASIFMEKSLALKFYLCLNSIAVMLLWAMGSIDKINMPF